ncbi:MAG: hypothetical protein HYU43_07995 [Armatimonadetes bacterium]|nr:hypothetical protein [Armatimonadota bacterium]
MTRKVWRWFVTGVIALVVAGGFGTSLLSGPAAAQATRTIYMAAVEPKGGTQATSEAFPTAALPPGGGYVLKAPDASGRWEVSTYQWQPSFIVAREGEQVTLEIIGINGAEHVSSLPPFVNSFTVRRGQLTRVSFTANRAGMFPILCVNHQPTMTGYLLVLPRP